MFKREICALTYTCTCIYFGRKEDAKMLTSMRKFFTEKGQGIVEYALLLAFVVAIAVYALGSDSGLGGAIKTNFSNTASAVTNFSSTVNGSTGGGQTSNP